MSRGKSATNKSATNENGSRARKGPTQPKGKTAMSTESWGAALIVAGALFALSGCETPRTDDVDDLDTLRSQVSDLEARVSAAEASASQAASSADQCSQVCERTESMFQQSLRK